MERSKMALILCRGEAKFPFYYERLDTYLYSLEELGYALGNFLCLVPEHFVSKELCEWLIDGLSEKELGEKLLDLKAMGEKEERLLFRLIRETGYYTEKEADELSFEWRRLNGLSDAEKKERMGDCFFALRKYGKALDAYQDAVHFEENGRRIRKIGESYIHTGEFQRAAESYKKLYEKNHDKMAARKLYFLSKMCFPKDKYRSFFQNLEEGLTEVWEKEWQDSLGFAKRAAAMHKIEESYREGREAFLSFAREKIESWKNEIRGRA